MKKSRFERLVENPDWGAVNRDVNPNSQARLWFEAGLDHHSLSLEFCVQTANLRSGWYSHVFCVQTAYICSKKGFPHSGSIDLSVGSKEKKDFYLICSLKALHSRMLIV